MSELSVFTILHMNSRERPYNISAFFSNLNGVLIGWLHSATAAMHVLIITNQTL